VEPVTCSERGVIHDPIFSFTRRRPELPDGPAGRQPWLVQSSATLDKGDLKLLNAMGDLINPPACRSHSAWGKFVAAPTRTLSTRRVDYTLPAGLKSLVYHHLVLARQPDGGGVRWVSLGIPGLVGTATAVSEYGTLVSLHDYQSQVAVGAHLPRTLAARLALTMVAAPPVANQSPRPALVARGPRPGRL